jgi:hypothetical protein
MIDSRLRRKMPGLFYVFFIASALHIRGACVINAGSYGQTLTGVTGEAPALRTMLWNSGSAADCHTPGGGGMCWMNPDRSHGVPMLSVFAEYDQNSASSTAPGPRLGSNHGTVATTSRSLKTPREDFGSSI